MRVQTEEWRKFVPGVRMYQGKKTLFYNGCPLIDYNGFPLVYSTEERKTWEVVILLPGVEVVPAFTFKECINLERVIMNDDVKRLEEGCFCKCLMLVSVSFSKNLQFIGRFAFYRCYSLASIDIPSTCGDVDVLAFDGCNQLNINYESNSETANEVSTNETLEKDVEVIPIGDSDTGSKHGNSFEHEEESSTESKRRKTNYNADIEIPSNSSTFKIVTDIARAKKVTKGFQNPSHEDDKNKLKRKSKELQRDENSNADDNDSRSVHGDHTTSSYEKEDLIRDLFVKMKAITKQFFEEMYLEEISCLHGKYKSTEEQLQVKQRDHEIEVEAFVNDLSKLEFGLYAPVLDEQKRSALDIIFFQTVAHIRNLKNNLQTKEKECETLIAQEKIYKSTITEKENGIKVLSNDNRILQARLAELEHIWMLHQQETNQMRQHISTLELKQQQFDDLKRQNDELVKRLKAESEKYELLQNKQTEFTGKDAAIINKMYSDLSKAHSLVRQQMAEKEWEYSKQLKEKEREYSKLVAIMDDKFTALIDEKQQLDEMLQLKEDKTTQGVNRETRKMEDSKVDLTKKEDLDGATSFVTQVQQSFPHLYEQFLEILGSYRDQENGLVEVMIRVVELFQGEKSIIQGFNAFIPGGGKIVLRNGKVYYRTPVQPILTPIPVDLTSTKHYKCPTTSWFHTIDELSKDYFAIKKLNEDLKKNVNETAKELRAKEEELNDVKNELIAKEKEVENVVAKETKVQYLEQSLCDLKKKTDKNFKALEAVQKKSKDFIRNKNRVIEMKEKDILSKESTIKMQKEEIERLQQELSKANSKQVALPKDLLSELECPICLDPFEDPCIVPECCHRFCTSCIENSFKECGKECPLCRKRVTSKRQLRKDGFIERITNIIFRKNEGKDGEKNS